MYHNPAVPQIRARYQKPKAEAQDQLEGPA